MGVVITARDKSLDVTFGFNKRCLLLIFPVGVRDNKMLNNISTSNTGQNESPFLENTLSCEATVFLTH